MGRLLHPKERVYRLPNQSSKFKAFHFVNTSGFNCGSSYDSAARSFVLTGPRSPRRQRSDSWKHGEEGRATNQRAQCEGLEQNRPSKEYPKTKFQVGPQELPVESSARLDEPFYLYETPISRFQQGPSDPFQCFGRPISNLEIQLIHECMG